MGTDFSNTQISILQYALFLGIGLILFGLMDKKEKLSIVGLGVFILSGIFAFWLLPDMSKVPELAEGLPVPKWVKIVAYLKLTIYFAVFCLVPLALYFFKNRYLRTSLFVTAALALGLFFIVLKVLQTPN